MLLYYDNDNDSFTKQSVRLIALIVVITLPLRVTLQAHKRRVYAHRHPSSRENLDMVNDSAKDHAESAVDPLFNTAVEDQMPSSQ